MSHVRARAALIHSASSKLSRLSLAVPSTLAAIAALLTGVTPAAAQPAPAQAQPAPAPAPPVDAAPPEEAAPTQETAAPAPVDAAPLPPPAPTPRSEPTEPTRGLSPDAGVATRPVAVPPPPPEPAKLTAYGFVRLDVIYNDSRFNNAQSPQWVLSEPDGTENNADLNIHPRLTRLGLDIGPIELTEAAKIDGKVEVDFQNGGTESRQAIRMRHAYAQIKYGSLEVLFGQTWDLIAPLFPMVNNDTLMWNAGNVGDRRPQVRFTARPTIGDGYVRIAASAGMPGAVDGMDLDEDLKLDGSDGTTPLLEGLLEGGIPLWKETLKLGAWAHYGRTEVATAVAGETEFESWSAGLHAFIPLTAMAWIHGEAFIGENLSDVRGGIGQGVVAGKEVRSKGGWAELGVALFEKKYSAAVGATIDQPDDSDLPDGGRTRNNSFYLTQKLAPAKALALGLDYLYWQTRYKNTPDGAAHRVDFYASMPF